jgi:hypothetical protein
MLWASAQDEPPSEETQPTFHHIPIAGRENDAAWTYYTDSTRLLLLSDCAVWPRGSDRKHHRHPAC